MRSRHTLIYVLFFAVVGTVGILRPTPTHSAPAVAGDDVPPAALEALRQGRYLRASLLLRDYLASRPDPGESTIILAAQAEAGWGEWARVRELLEGRNWLDRVAAGQGWHLLGRSQLELGELAAGSVSLGRFLEMGEPSGAGTQRAFAHITRAQALAGQRDFAAAAAAWEEAADALPQIADWIHAFAAGTAALAGDTAAVRKRLGRAGGDLAREWAWRAEPRARRNAGDRAGAVAAATRAAERLSSQHRRAAAWTMVGQLHQERGNRAGARSAFLRAIEAADGTSSAIDAARALSGLPGITPEDQLLIGRLYIRHGNLPRGIAGLTAYLESDHGSPAQREQVQYEMADAYFRSGDHGRAESALLAVAASVSDPGVAADALYTAARAQYRAGRADAARVTLRRVIRDHERQPAAARAAFLAADLYHDEHELERAVPLYQHAILSEPRSPEAAVARMRIGGIDFAAGRFDSALDHFQQYRAATQPDERSYGQATFWTGMALLRLGRTAEAQALFREVRGIDPFAWYGGLAAAQLGDDIWQLRLDHPPPPNSRFDPLVLRALARVDLLKSAGWQDAAAFEMERVRRHFAHFDGALYVLAEELNARGFINEGVALGRDIYRREGAWNTRLLRIVYPFPFRDIILAEAREQRVDPFLVVALIRQESMFNPRAQSFAGAMGLMQVMPRTGQGLARTLGVPRFQPDMLFQPDLNVAFGVRYLAEQLNVYGNRLDVVLAAYNAGPGRVGRWQRFPEYREPLLFGERIPFDETRNYVRIVQNNRRIYAALYADLLPPPSAD
jgi:soluble lytic murein transglycosylase